MLKFLLNILFQMNLNMYKPKILHYHILFSQNFHISYFKLTKLSNFQVMQFLFFCEDLKFIYLYLSSKCIHIILIILQQACLYKVSTVFQNLSTLPIILLSSNSSVENQINSENRGNTNWLLVIHKFCKINIFYTLLINN